MSWVSMNVIGNAVSPRTWDTRFEKNWCPEGDPGKAPNACAAEESASVAQSLADSFLFSKRPEPFSLSKCCDEASRHARRALPLRFAMSAARERKVVTFCKNARESDNA